MLATSEPVVVRQWAGQMLTPASVYPLGRDLAEEVTRRFIRASLAPYADLHLVGLRMEGEQIVARVRVRGTALLSEWAFPLNSGE